MNTTLYQNRPQLNKFAFGTRPGGGGAGLLLYNGLMGMCRWMGSHFHDWIDNNGVPFSIITRMESHIFGFFAGYLAWENRRHFATPSTGFTRPNRRACSQASKGWPHHRGLCPLLFSNSSVGSSTSHKNRSVKVLWDRTYEFSSLSEKTRKSNHLQISLQMQHFLPSYFKDPECWPGRGLNPRPPAQQTGTLPTELTSAEEVFVMTTIPLLFFQSHLATPEHPLFLH